MQIPQTIPEAIKILLAEPGMSQSSFRKTAPEDAIATYHHTFGRQLRNDWELWSHGPLYREFDSIGIFHADDMSSILLTTLHRILNHEPVKLREQVRYYQAFGKKRRNNETNI